MPTLDDVYRKFGEAAEAAQIIETTLGNMLFAAHCLDEDLFENQDPARAADILQSVNRQTLGALLKSVNRNSPSLDTLNSLLVKARDDRNRLSHSFYRQHNLRRNSDEGRSVMMRDLETIHAALLDALKALLLLDGIDPDALTVFPLPTGHLPI